MLKIPLPGCLAILLPLCSASVYSQPDTSATHILNKTRLSFEMATRNADSAFLLARQAVDYSLHTGFKEGLANAYNSLGWTFMHKGQYDSSIYYLQLAKSTFAAINSDRDLARVGINLSEAYTRQSYFSRGIESLLEAEAAAKRVNDEPLLTDIKRQLGIIYREAGDQQKAIDYLREAMNGFIRLKDDSRYVHTALSLAIVLNSRSMHDSALAILEKGLAILSKIPGKDYQTAMVHEHIGESWKGLNQHHRSLKHYRIAYSMFQKIGNTVDIAYESINIGRALMKMQSYDEAERYLTDAYRLTDSLGLANYHQEALTELAALYRSKRQWAKAYHYLAKSVALGDSLTVVSNLAHTKELKEKYESEKKEQEIVLLKKNNDLNLLALQRQRTNQFAIGTVAVLLLLVGVLLINRYRVVQRSRRTIELEKMRNQIASDLHDDIGSTLSSMNILSKMMAQQANGNETLHNTLQRISEHSSVIMDNMADIVWAIHPGNDSVQKVIYRMKEFAAELLEPLNIIHTFKLDGDFSQIQLDPRQRKNLYLICKEALNNAAKYSQCKQIAITLKQSKHFIELNIADDGIGFDNNSIGGGNGLRNMQQRARELQGELVLHTRRGEGTTVLFKMSTAIVV